jgi:ABC-type multidrug transport system fused ATPase/permease subunit
MRDMTEDRSTISATITYAVLSVALRLLAAQLGVFNLWYQRRAYERSRGELITMLYEKTLNRKILGAKQESKERESNGHTEGHGAAQLNGDRNDTDESSKAEPKSWFTRTLIFTRSLFSRKPKEAEKEKVAASMGKILNLMRNDVYEVAQRFWDFADIVTQPVGAIFATLLIWVSVNVHGAMRIILTLSSAHARVGLLAWCVCPSCITANQYRHCSLPGIF